VVEGVVPIVMHVVLPPAERGQDVHAGSDVCVDPKERIGRTVFRTARAWDPDLHETTGRSSEPVFGAGRGDAAGLRVEYGHNFFGIGSPRGVFGTKRVVDRARHCVSRRMRQDRKDQGREETECHFSRFPR
jgi:hypothetical protein